MIIEDLDRWFCDLTGPSLKRKIEIFIPENNKLLTFDGIARMI